MKRHHHGGSAEAVHRAEWRRARRRRRRARVPGVMMAGAAFFTPHAGHGAQSKRPSVPASLAQTVARGAVPVVTTEETFRLSPDYDCDAIVLEAAERFGLAPALIRAVIQTESAFDPMAVSTAGAQGLMQLMPALSKELGVDDPFNPRQNIMAGSQYLSALLSYFNGDLSLALASYNAGPGMVERYNGIPPFEETQHYVKTIVGLIAEEPPQRR
jgi:soluble lytic murein transglycosylase-like protein